MFTQSAWIYDVVFRAKGKNYTHETDQLRAILHAHGVRDGASLLEIACGTGNHTQHLRRWYRVTGLDLDPEMLKIARGRYRDVPFHLGNMVHFALGRTFDVVICLASAIAYAKTLSMLRRAVANMAHHLRPGGMVLAEPWIGPEEFRTGAVFSTFVDLPDLKIARMNVNERRDNISVLKFHYLVGTPQGVRHFTELHELGLYTSREYAEAFHLAGLQVAYDDRGLIGRGMYIGRKPLPVRDDAPAGAAHAHVAARP